MHSHSHDFISCNVVTWHSLMSFLAGIGLTFDQLFSSYIIAFVLENSCSAVFCLMIVTKYFKVDIFCSCPKQCLMSRGQFKFRHFLVGTSAFVRMNKFNVSPPYLTYILYMCHRIGLPMTVLTKLLHLTVLPLALQTCELH